MSGAKAGLDLVGVDDSGKIGVGHLGAGENESLLHGGGAGEGPEDGVQLVESRLSPDTESTQVTSGGELQQVQAVNRHKLDTRKIAESPQHGGLLVVDDQRTLALDVPPVPQLSLSGADLLGVLDLLNISVGTEGLQDLDGELGLVNVLDRLAADNQRDFLDLFHTVPTSHDQRGESRSSQSRANSNTALVQVGLARPSAPDLGRGEHTSTAAHLRGTFSKRKRKERREKRKEKREKREKREEGKHTLPKAPCPARWVPPPETRGIRATALPVPQDSAEVCSPACLLTA